MYTAIKYFLIFIIIAILVYFFKKSADKKPNESIEGIIEFKGNTAMDIMSLIFGLLSLGILGFSIYMLISNSWQVAGMIFFGFLFIFGLSIPNILASIFYKVIVTDLSIRERNLLGKWKELKWTEIDEVYYYKFNKDLILKGSGVKIRFNRYLTGFPVFLEMTKERTSLPIKNYDAIEF